MRVCVFLRGCSQQKAQPVLVNSMNEAGMGKCWRFGLQRCHDFTPSTPSPLAVSDATDLELHFQPGLVPPASGLGAGWGSALQMVTHKQVRIFFWEVPDSIAILAH